MTAPPSYFQSSASDAPVRVVLVGAGHMGQRWLQAIDESDDVELAGIVDLDLQAAQTAAAHAGLPERAVGTDLVEVARTVRADAVVNVTVVNAHYPVTLQALEAGLAVLGEKPVAATLDEAIVMAASARQQRRLFMVSQSRRYHRGLHTLQEVASGLGPIGDATALFFRASDFGGFRNQMRSPLLIDMAIHAFDAARFLTGQDPVSVFAEEHNPAWSWYREAASATAIFTMSGGTRFVYTGSWCSPGLPTPWNGRWRISARDGAAQWDGDARIEVGRAGSDAVTSIDPGSTPAREGVAGALADFVQALRTGTAPRGDVHENIYSLAMVDAAVASARTGSRVDIDALMGAELERARASTRTPDGLRGLLELPARLPAPASTMVDVSS